MPEPRPFRRLEISPGSRLYSYFYDISITLAAFGTAIAATQNAIDMRGKGARFVVTTTLFDAMLEMPGTDLLLNAAADHPEISLIYEMRDLRTQAPAASEYVAVNVNRLIGAMDRFAWAEFILFYEHYWPAVLKHMESDAVQRPPSWAFARVLRNGIGHGGMITIKRPDAPPVAWRGIEIGPKHNGLKVVEFIDLAGIIALMIDLNADLSGLGYRSSR